VLPHCGKSFPTLLRFFQESNGVNLIVYDGKPFLTGFCKIPAWIDSGSEDSLQVIGILKDLGFSEDSISSDPQVRCRNGMGHSLEDIYALRSGALCGSIRRIAADVHLRKSSRSKQRRNDLVDPVDSTQRYGLHASGFLKLDHSADILAINVLQNNGATRCDVEEIEHKPLIMRQIQGNSDVSPSWINRGGEVLNGFIQAIVKVGPTNVVFNNRRIVGHGLEGLQVCNEFRVEGSVVFI
jgi:hypothetical protein